MIGLVRFNPRIIQDKLSPRPRPSFQPRYMLDFVILPIAISLLYILPWFTHIDCIF
ncbi:hypothetical protein BDW71DRAFT_132861 [Aspergillus fruticulosus]